MTFLWRTKRVPLFSQGEIQATCNDMGSESRIRLKGRITIDSTPGLRTLFFERLDATSCQTLTVDCVEVSYIDTSGLAMLVEALRAARMRAKAFRLEGLQERPRFLLEKTRLLHLFDESVPEATGKSLTGNPL